VFCLLDLKCKFCGTLNHFGTADKLEGVQENTDMMFQKICFPY